MPGERPRRTEHGKAGRNPTPSGWRLIAVQSISCAAVIIIIIILKLIGGSAFTQLRHSFNKSIMSNSILATLAALVDAPDKRVDDRSQSTTSTTGTETEQTTSTQSSSAQSSTSHTDTSSATGGSSKTATSAVTTAPTSALATGGQDIPVIQKSVQYAPEGASFVPLKVSRIAHKPLKNGKITSLFGYRGKVNNGGEGFHQGLDIAVEPGSPVAAMYFGVVREVGAGTGYGNYIRLYHGNGIEVLYAHCSQILADKGAVIRAGEIVAYSGSTGDSTGPHVHIEVTFHGIAYNPAGIVPVDYYD